MENNPISNDQLAELDRWREAAPVNKWAVGKSPRNGRVQVHNGQIQVCAVWSTYTNPAQGTAEYIAALHNAYPALRQRLLDAESRLAEAERERDAAAKEWEAVVAENSTLLAHMPEQINVERSFRRTVAGLADRDAQQRREGAAEWLEALIAAHRAQRPCDPFVPVQVIEIAAKRLREGKDV